MTIRGQLLPALAVLLTVSACDSRTPTVPADPATQSRGRSPGPIDLPPVFAEISIRSISHESGGTLMLRDCGAAGGARPQFCTDELQAVFEVAADRDMPSVGLRLTFSNDGQRCAIALTSSAALSAHVPRQMGATLTDYYVNVDEPGTPADLGCDRPPVATTNMIVELMDYSEVPQGVSVVTKQFPYGYRFVIP